MRLIELLFFSLCLELIDYAATSRGVNGVLNATAIPSQLNIAATFSRELSYIAGAVAGSESRLLNACKVFLRRE
jgi:beta-glucosidase-like glycosyl hydrolase